MINVLSLLLLISSSTYISITFNYLLNIILVFALLFLVILRTKKLSINISNVISLVAVVFLLIINILHCYFVYDDNLILNQMIFLSKIIILSMLLASKDDFSYKLILKMADIIFYISMVSLLLWLMKSFFGTDFLPIWQVGNVKTSFLSTYYGVDFSGLNLYRNSSIFYEPGVFGTYLTLSLLIFSNNQCSRLKLFFIYISIISTFSPLPILLSFLIMMKDKIKNISFKVFIPFFLLVILYGLYIFLQGKITSLSYQIRVYDIIVGWHEFIQSPLVGWGLFYESNINEINFFDITGRGLSNGIMALLYQLGLFMATIYIHYLSKSISVYCSVRYIYSLVIIILIFIFQPIQYSNVFIFIFVSGLVCYEKQRNIINSSKCF